MTTDSAPSIAAWTAYWRTGRGASCFEGGHTEVALAKIWEEFVDGLAGGARLLDLATGNGTVARVCAGRARLRNIKLSIDAVDAAEIDPPKVMADPAGLLTAIRFRGGVRLEALPFADAAFDAVVSQFGFEYAQEGPAIAETVRVLAPGGRLKLVMHARDGAVSRDVGRRLERLRAVLDEHGPVTLVRTLARALDAGDSATIARESMHLREATDLARSLANDAPRDDAALFYASEFLRSWTLRARYKSADLRRSVEDGWSNADGVAARQAEMLRVARTRDDIDALSAKFAAAGLLVTEAKDIRDDRRGAQIAWLMTAHKPAAGGAVA